MKIIEPITNLGALSTNDAPLDALETWEPAGRDLLNYIEKPVVDVVGDLMVVASSVNSGPIYSVDLVTGIVTDTGVQTTLAAINLKISPNGSYVYFCDRVSERWVRNKIFNTATWAQDFTTAERFIVGVVFDQIIANNAHWCSDSTKVYFTDVNILREVSGFPFAETNSVELNNTEMPYWSLAVKNNGNFVVYATPFINNYNLLELNTSFVKVKENDIYGANTISYNPVLDSVVCSYNNELRTVNSADLTVGAKILSNKVLGKDKSILSDGTHLIVRSLSTTPYWNYYSLTDYSLVKSLPALPTAGEAISVGTNYTVVQQNNGIALIDNTDDSIVSQQNPSVATGDQCIYVDNVYEALTNNSDQPDMGAKTDPPTWLDRGKINPLRMFDGKLDSLTTSSNILTTTINPDQLVSGIALFNVDAAVVRVTMTDPIDGLVYDSGDISMIDNSGVNDWFAFYFSPYIKKSDFVSMMLPPYPDAEIVVTIDGLSAQVSIGEIVIGRTFTLGVAQFGSSVGILDFSEKEQDQFGNFNIIERKFSKRADYDVKIPTNTVSGVQRILSRFRARPAVWVGDENREETIVYGYYKSFDIVLSNPALSDTSILVEGL